MIGGVHIKTYQDLLSVGSDEKKRMAFIHAAISDHTASGAYKVAKDAEEYYAKRNVTMSNFQKVLYTLQGRAVPDIWSANFKTKTAFFRTSVIQLVQYILSNGVTFGKPDTKKKLGNAFDYAIQRMAKKAMVDGVSFGFWNFDHLEVFSYIDTPQEPGFVPLYDEDTSLLCAGIRYWYPNGGKTTRATLYELDGYTDYIQRKGEEMKVLVEKRPLVSTITRTEIGGVEGVLNESYPGFPIIPMYANDLQESELVGIREAIDCYDYIKNGLANDVDDAASLYWTLENTGGMNDVDLAQFLERMKVVKAAVIDGDAGAKAEAHTLDVPIEARRTMLEILTRDLYRDAQVLNVAELSATSKTATEIRAAYQSQDDKCGDFEYCIRDFIGKLLALIGIEDEPSFKWNRIANQTEETQMVMTAATYLDDEAVLKHLPWLTPEEVDEILQRRDAEALDILTGGVATDDESDGDVAPPMKP